MSSVVQYQIYELSMAGLATLISPTTVPTGSPHQVVRLEMCECECFATESFISLTPVRTQLTSTHIKVFNQRIHNVANLSQGLLNTLFDWMTPQIFCHVTCSSQQ